jgi:Ras-related protein Rab-1A
MDSAKNEYDFLFKLLLIGDSGVGKSSMLLRFADNEYTDKYISTIGVDFKIKTICNNDSIIKLQLWDTAGQERFRTITTSYYRGAHGIILAFDITNRISFYNIKLWLAECEKFASKNVSKIIVGTKSDLIHLRQVDYEEACVFAEEHGMTYVENSSKNSVNIDLAFNTLIESIIKKTITTKIISNKNNTPKILSDTYEPTNYNSRCC